MRTKIQNCLEIWKPEPSDVSNVKRFMPRIDCFRSVSANLEDNTLHKHTATNDAGRYIKVTIVTKRTVAESSTVSFVKLHML